MYWKRVVLFCLILNGTSAWAQKTMEEYVKEGIDYHDRGQYDLAIEAYQQALAINENSDLVNYEIAMTYHFAKQYDKALAHADKVIQLNEKYLIPAYTTKGNCLDAMGQSEEAIKTYQEALARLGDNYLLYYNMALTYYNMNRSEASEAAALQAIRINPKHASSHLLLGYLLRDQEKKVQSILSLHYFLFLEPHSSRSKGAFDLLTDQFYGNVEKGGGSDVTINLSSGSLDKKNEFGSAELMISMLAASNNLEENKDKSTEELFVSNSESFFKILGEIKKKKYRGLWWEFYVPFYYDMAQTWHLETYCYYISQSDNPEAQAWLKANTKRLDLFNAWLSKR
ncbi:tetratricopeptide repeat protein [Reichenbachiella ulvae]|uniref:Tetratricopeptide repeat protein n=1 Tax=Reichenbachiella ulvae TaxID=2980104 RepID=A0ABT3CZV7_9BACT|nr:tetratricopeptide repeat protein [Reichenbachiella ulvae]MCV9389059.1 tetratricopeptide repeat protein [Reichenbachiella ulvae]